MANDLCVSSNQITIKLSIVSPSRLPDVCKFESDAVANGVCVSCMESIWAFYTNAKSDLGCINVVVAKFLLTSSWKTLLWLRWHRLGNVFVAIVVGTYKRQMTIDLEKVAVANVLVTSSLKMLLWRTLCAFHTFRKPCDFLIVTPIHFPHVCKFENYAVARVS